MIKHFLRFVPIVAGIGLSAFCTRTITVYMVYQGFGAQTDKSNYIVWNSDPGEVEGSDRLYWFVINDNDGTITATEFSNAFNAIDGQYGGTINHSLNDEYEDHTTLEKMAVVF